MPRYFAYRPARQRNDFAPLRYATRHDATRCIASPRNTTQRLMIKRKHISLKTRCASLIIQCGLIPYDDAKLMTDDQILSLTEIDHNVLHETGHPNRDRAYNLTHMLIKAHREKTKQDAKVIAKGRRIRAKQKMYLAASTGLYESTGGPFRKIGSRVRKIQSRGFIKAFRRKMDGTVEKR